MLQVENLTKSFGDLLLFDEVSFSVDDGEKVGLIAPNGTGKTTLLRILMGDDVPDDGRIIFSKDMTVAYLPQRPEILPEHTILEACLDNNDHQTELIRRWKEALQHNDNEAMTELSPQIDSLNLWSFEHKVSEVLGKLGLVDIDRTCKSLSGGETKRIALARLLIKEPNLLILDEPTNHLDLDAIEWLEDYLTRSQMGLLLVTHDRYFLDRICTRIIEIDQKKIYSYNGNYNYYLEKRDERLSSQEQSVLKAKNLMRKELDWIRRQPQARGTKAKYRIDAFAELKQKASEKRQEVSIDLSNHTATYIGKKIFEAYDVSKSFGNKKIVDRFNYIFARYDKVGIVGPNGVGKSTFLKLLLGIEQPDSGYFEIGETVRFGYYSQEMPPFDPQKRVIDIITDIADEITYPGGQRISASQLLTRFLFEPDKQYNFVGKLSGGEMRRLYLCTVLIGAPNFLVLDEPTNDLDIVTLNVLEEYISEFKGCVLIVSHDRYFMDKVAEHIFVFKGEGIIKDFPGSYSQWRIHDEFETLEKSKAEASIQTAKSYKPERREKKKLSYKEQKEYDANNQQIKKLEIEKADLESKLSSGSLRGEALMEASTRIGEVNDEMDLLTLRQLELEDTLS
ncbi:ABC-F family ATP-binding cassette domain-containing protein [Falsiporphyromonas endometrii]|uniref:ABC-F family ATP-binding cassette domain-containing protein n=1 Tax=Falsiporphyromonas endometrii TaxID=1387297 RepID=A0ABV9K896_9PORP